MASKNIYEVLGDDQEDSPDVGEIDVDTAETESEDTIPVRFATTDSRGKSIPIQPPYADTQDLNDSYEAVYHSFDKSPAKQELCSLLEPFRGSVDRIAIVGLGLPYRGEWGVFAQLAMAEHAMQYLQSPTPQHRIHIKMLVCEPNLNAMDEEFLRNKLDMKNIDWGAEEYDADERPDEYYLDLPDPRKFGDLTRVSDLSFAEKGTIRHLAAEITSSTLLFMPNVAAGLTTRYVQATNPLLVITNHLGHFYNNIAPTHKDYLFADTEQRHLWDKEWAIEWEGYEKLRDNYWRKELVENREFTRNRNKFWIYAGGAKKGASWADSETGHLNLDCKIEDAVDAMLYG